MRLVTASLIGLLSATPLLAQEPVAEGPVEQEEQHVVRVGDTLWDLAGRYFNDPYRWRAIYEANTHVVRNPHWIYPAEVLTIPGVARSAGDPRDTGRQRVAVSRPQDDTPSRTVFYRSPPPQAQSQDPATVLLEPVEPRAPVRPGEFTSAAYLMDPSHLAVQASYMRPVREDRPGRGRPASAHPRDQVYLQQRPGTAVSAGDRLMLVEVGRAVSGAAPGARIIQPRAVVRVVELLEHVIEAQVEHQYGPVLPGLAVIPVTKPPEFEVEAADPVASGFDLVGTILEFVDEKPLYGPSALALVNLGRAHGVREGDIFEAYLPPRVVHQRETGTLETRTERLPTEIVAELRAVRVTDSYATLRVDDVFLARLDAGVPVRRIRKMP